MFCCGKNYESVNECLEKVASYGIMPNMILYLSNDYGMAIVEGRDRSAMCSVLSLFGAFLSDSYFGRFIVICIGSFSSLLVSHAKKHVSSDVCVFANWLDKEIV